jgi:hypothetical protein
MVVTKLFPFVDQNEIIIHIASYDWDFQNFGPVDLKIGNESIHCRYTGSGTQSNEAVLKLALDDPQYTSVATVAKKYGEFHGAVVVERSTTATNDVSDGER